MALEDNKRVLATSDEPAKKQKRQFWTKEDKEDPLNTLLQAVQHLEKYEKKTAETVVDKKIKSRPDTMQALKEEHEKQWQVVAEKFQLLQNVVMKLKSQYGTIENVNKQLGLNIVVASSSSNDTVAVVKAEEMQAKFLQQLEQLNGHMADMKKQKPLMIQDDPAIRAIDKKINKVDEKLNSMSDISAMAVEKYIEDNGSDVEQQAVAQRVQELIDDDDEDEPDSLNGKAIDKMIADNVVVGELRAAAIDQMVENDEKAGELRAAAIDKMIEDDTEAGELWAAAIDKMIEDDDDDALKKEAKEKKLEAEKDDGSESDSSSYTSDSPEE